ncbi:MAG: cytochrome c [Gammaproteobacteria bacterium]
MYRFNDFDFINRVFMIIFFVSLMSISSCSKDDSKQQLKLKQLQTKWNWGDKKWMDNELLILDKGEQLYLENCALCHSVNGMGDIGRRSPILIDNPLVNEKADIPIKITLFGKRKMPGYSEKFSDEFIAAVLSYVRNAWSNTSGVLISEKEVQNYRHYNLKKLQQKWNWDGKQWQEKELRFLEFGENNYLINCAGCHTKNGNGQTQIGAAGLKNNSLIIGNPEQQIRIILSGIDTMPSYAKLLSNEVIASIISYEKNTWGNKSGELVNPDQVEALRKNR